MTGEQPDILPKLAENEEAVGALYRVYAKRFPDHGNLWSSLADEEDEHAGWIRVLCSTARAGGLSIDRGRFRGEAIQTYLNYLSSELARVKQGETTLLNALSVTLYIEESLIESRFFEVFEADAPQLKQLLRNLESATKAHAARTREALRNFKRARPSG